MEDGTAGARTRVQDLRCRDRGRGRGRGCQFDSLMMDSLHMGLRLQGFGCGGLAAGVWLQGFGCGGLAVGVWL